MDPTPAKALAAIRECVTRDRVFLTPHFRQRLAERNLLWADVLTVLDHPRSVRADGSDPFGRGRWLIVGDGADGARLEMVCTLAADERGRLVVFVTIYPTGES